MDFWTVFGAVAGAIGGVSGVAALGVAWGARLQGWQWKQRGLQWDQSMDLDEETGTPITVFKLSMRGPGQLLGLEIHVSGEQPSESDPVPDVFTRDSEPVVLRFRHPAEWDTDAQIAALWPDPTWWGTRWRGFRIQVQEGTLEELGTWEWRLSRRGKPNQREVAIRPRGAWGSVRYRPGWTPGGWFRDPR